MTDPELADRTYVEPLTPEVLAAIIERERPDALLPTVGGQTALNLAVDLAERRHAREVQRRADRRVDRGDQDRRGPAAVQGRDARDRPRRAAERLRADRWPRRSSWRRTLGFPLIIRPSFTLGGVGGGIAYNIEEFRELAERGLELSPVHEVLVEESVIGWKEFELEVMRDVADNFVVICSIENIDPMGVHTGDSITVAPILTLTDKEYQRMRDAARRIIRKVGVETGGSNIQFADQPGERPDDRHRDEPARVALVGARVEGDRVSRSRRSPRSSRSAITSTRSRTTSRALTPASFEPTIDYVVVKIPRWNFEKFPQADRTLTTQMKSVGEAMAIGRTFKEAFMKGVRSLELGTQRPAVRARRSIDDGRRCGAAEAAGGARATGACGICSARSSAAGRVEQLHELTQDRSVVPAPVRRDRATCGTAAAERGLDEPRASRPCAG